MMESFACYVYCSACRPRGLQGFQELDLDDAELALGVAAVLGLEEVERNDWTIEKNAKFSTLK